MLTDIDPISFLVGFIVGTILITLFGGLFDD